VKASLRILLEGVVDYAGLFPPAGLDMTTTTRRYAKYAEGPRSWALGRFIVPVSRLEEFNFSIADLSGGGLAGSWRVSALAGSDLSSDLEKIEACNRWHAERDARVRVVVDTIELKAATPELIEQAGNANPGTLRVFFEIPVDRDPTNLLSTISKTGKSAKVRTGGVTRGTFPAAGDITRFLDACLRAGVGFKATAGLHHPLRGLHPLTYEPDSANTVMHGFLNLLLCAAFMHDGMGPDEAGAVLSEEAAAAFKFDEEGVEWRGHRLANPAIAAARREFAMSFGSCSFEEPLEDLKTLRFL
jgi:hypothetical protein